MTLSPGLKAMLPKPARPAGFFPHVLHCRALALLLFTGWMVLSPIAHLTAQALTQNVTLKKLGVDSLAFLPTIRAQRELTFTKPRDWNVSGATVEVTFQHSQQLIDGSWLQVIVNDKVLKHIPLNKTNVNNTTVTASVPGSLIQDGFNKLIFRVEQHYSKKCEDPVDPSLWTNVLESTKLVFNYAKKPAPLTLQAFPYPIVDRLAYEPTPLRYLLGQQPGSETLEAMALLNIVFAQEKPQESLKTSVQIDGAALPKTDENLVILGTGSSLSGTAKTIASAITVGGYRLQGNQWVGPNGTLADGEAIVGVARHPGQAANTVLLVAANDEAGVLRGAQYLAARPKEDVLKAAATVVPASWSVPGGGVTQYAPYIANETRSLADLGFPVQAVEHITAPPITLDIPVVSDFRDASANLVFDLNYSYGPDVNPKYSALELRLNDRSIGNVPLTNMEGQERGNIQIPVPRDLLKTDNKFVAQFHLMPDKYGFCVDDYVDKAWGKIHEDSRLLVQGSPESKLPNLSLLSLGRGYPYTLQPDLGETQVLLTGAEPSQLEALLAVTSRLGRFASSQQTPMIKVGLLGANATVDTGKHLVLIDRITNAPDDLVSSLELTTGVSGNALALDWKGPMTRVSISEASRANPGVLEMAMLNGNRVLTRLSASTPQALSNLASLLENDAAFTKLPDGRLTRADGTSLLVTVDELKATQNIGTDRPAGGKVAPTEASSGTGWWDSLWAKPWFRWTVYGVLALFAIFFVVPLLVSLIFGKGRR